MKRKLDIEICINGTLITKENSLIDIFRNTINAFKDLYNSGQRIDTGYTISFDLSDIERYNKTYNFSILNSDNNYKLVSSHFHAGQYYILLQFEDLN